MEQKNDNKTAFISGYSPEKISLQTLLSEVKRSNPGATYIRSPHKSKIWTGIGFIEFRSIKDCTKFIEQKRIRLFQISMNLVIKRAKQGKNLAKTVSDRRKRRLKIKKIPLQWDDYYAENFLRKFGKIENCYILKPFEKKKVGEYREGIIIFTKRKSALQCFLQKKIHIGQGEYIEVSFLDNKINSNQSKRHQDTLRKRKTTVFLKTKRAQLGYDDLNNFPRVKQRDNSRIEEIGIQEEESFLMIFADGEKEFHQAKPTMMKYYESALYKEIRANKEFGRLMLNQISRPIQFFGFLGNELFPEC